ncbi:MAG: hypothetical protein ACI94Y_000338 [Maribacter sp.]|jgi:hypothetical protein
MEQLFIRKENITQFKGRSIRSSMSLILCFMHKIDPHFSNELFQKYKDEFLTYKFRLPGIREHYKDTDLGADVDSGLGR